MAELTTFPAEIIENARNMATQMRSSIEQRHFDMQTNDDLVRKGT